MNEIEKKEIDEMVVIIEKGSGEIATAVETAKALYNAGYRKVNFKEHSRYEIHSNDENLKAYKEGLSDGRAIAKQQAIKEVLEKVKHNMYMKSIIQLKGDNSPDLHTADMEKVIDDLLKEYERNGE